jgi:hypothetical protein
MMGSALSLLDPALHPRAGQQVTLDFHGHRIPGIVHSASGQTLAVRPQSMSLLRQLHPSSHLRALIAVRQGACEIVISQLGIREDEGLLRGQIVGHPVYVQRRAAPRTEVAVGAGLVWLDTRSAAWRQAEGRTENLSVGGALLHFPEQPEALPCQDCNALLGLWIPGTGGAVALAVRVLQAWDEGARVKVVDAAPEAERRFRTFVNSHL